MLGKAAITWKWGEHMSCSETIVWRLGSTHALTFVIDI